MFSESSITFACLAESGKGLRSQQRRNQYGDFNVSCRSHVVHSGGISGESGATRLLAPDGSSVEKRTAAPSGSSMSEGDTDGDMMRSLVSKKAKNGTDSTIGILSALPHVHTWREFYYTSKLDC